MSEAMSSSAARRFSHLSDSELIGLIRGYHEAHIRDLEAAAALARRVEDRHAGSPNYPAGLADLLARMAESVGSHQHREEAVLFPIILSGEGAMLRQPIAALGTEHDDLQDGLERLVRLTRDYTAPAEACASWRKLYELCRKYDEEFREHVQLEERILFPRFL